MSFHQAEEPMSPRNVEGNDPEMPDSGIQQRLAARSAAEKELILAGEIQASFLPRTLPEIPGWELAVTLKPARQTCGDFYDVISLPNGRVGLIIADVADKGAAAALYMALSRTLVRTFTILYHARPDFALRAANHRIRADTDSEQFVTLFLGVLDPATGVLSYANAGHNPPLLFPADPEGKTQPLLRTGIPLGMFDGKTWERESVRLAPGDTLLLYTDGITEAQNVQRELFGSGRLIRATRQHLRGSAADLQQGLTQAVADFVGDMPQVDDIALMVLKQN
jgi:sigma-B regulation protein RsbU (phosphoserine phosphatase)